jgi:hypothetical protein
MAEPPEGAAMNKTEPRKTIVIVPPTPELERQQVAYFERKLAEGAAYLRDNPPDPSDEPTGPIPEVYKVVKVDDEKGVVFRNDGKLVMSSPSKLYLCEIMARALNKNALKRNAHGTSAG